MTQNGFVKRLPNEELNTKYPREEKKDREMNQDTTSVLKVITKHAGLLNVPMHGFKTTDELP